MDKRLYYFIQFILVIQPILGAGIVSLFGGNYNKNSQKWYKLIKKPPLNPPDYIFPIVWPILYLLIGISSLFVFKFAKKNKNLYFILFEIQLILNWLWTLFFFKFNNLILSLITIFIMIILTVSIIFISYKYSKIASYMLIPYIIWICFACYLTFYITLNN